LASLANLNTTVFNSFRNIYRVPKQDFFYPPTLEWLLRYERVQSKEDLLHFLTGPVIGMDPLKYGSLVEALESTYEWLEILFQDTDSRRDGSNPIKGHFGPTGQGAAYNLIEYYIQKGEPPDYFMICAGTVGGLLHDGPEDIGLPFETIEDEFKRFGNEFAYHVRQFAFTATKYHMHPDAFEHDDGFNLEKGDKYTAEEYQEVVMEFPLGASVVGADNQSNHLTMDDFSPEEQRKFTRETVDVLGPIIYEAGFEKTAVTLVNTAMRNAFYDDHKSIYDIFPDVDTRIVRLVTTNSY
jgi:hypothetical protein